MHVILDTKLFICMSVPQAIPHMTCNNITNISGKPKSDVNQKVCLLFSTNIKDI